MSIAGLWPHGNGGHSRAAQLSSSSKLSRDVNLDPFLSSWTPPPGFVEHELPSVVIRPAVPGLPVMRRRGQAASNLVAFRDSATVAELRTLARACDTDGEREARGHGAEHIDRRRGTGAVAEESRGREGGRYFRSPIRPQIEGDTDAPRKFVEKER